MSRHRVAIVGGGPKALHALERLVAAARKDDRIEATIDVFEPATPGCGPAYDPALDPALLMNLRSGAVDAWPRSGPDAVLPDEGHPTLTDWAAAGTIPLDDYAPRAIVGRYLADAWRQVVDDAPPGLRVRHRRGVVERVAPAAETGWTLTTAGRSGDPRRYDDVLLATGHGAPIADDPRTLDLDGLAARRAIGVDGAGLTALDLVRGLAARRRRSARGPVVHLVSRTGRPPVPKPPPSRDAQIRALLDEARGAHRPELRSASAIRGALLADAAAILGAAPDAQTRAERALERLERRAPMDQREATAQLEHWIAAAEGAPAASADAGDGEADVALGAAWRWRYPQLVADAGGGALSASDRERFVALGAALELVAFGPPLAAAATLLAAMRDGWVRCWPAPARLEPTRDGAGVLTTSADASPLALDAVVRARQLPPGTGCSPLVASLARRGIVRLAPGGRGAQIDRDGTVRDERGRRQDGLAIIGRATEDWTIGNDTLDRTLHDVAARWAADVAVRIAEVQDAHAARGRSTAAVAA